MIMWQIWPGMKVSETGVFFYNTVHQLVRPLCMLTFFVTDLISLKIHAAVYIRMLSVISLSCLAMLIYRWQLLFGNKRLLAAIYAISAFTLPPFQVFAATQNYFLILLALLLTSVSLFCWHTAFYAAAPKRKFIYRWMGNLLYFLSFLEYPLSSMFAWVMLSICYLNILPVGDFVERRKFFYYACMLALANIVFYYLVIQVVHRLFPVDYPNFRSAVVNTSHLLPRLFTIFRTMIWHSNLWWWQGFVGWSRVPIAIISILFVIALWNVLSKRKNSTEQIIKKLFFNLGLVFLLFFLAYLPILATTDVGFTFRYGIATMPMLLYVALWSIDTIVSRVNQTDLAKVSQISSQSLAQRLAAIFYIALTVFAVLRANLMLADGIVGPHTNDFNFIQQQLTAKALPYIQLHERIILHVIDCDNGISKLYPGKTPEEYFAYLGKYTYPPQIPTAFEYGMRTCQFSQLALSVVIHSLNLYGYPSNYHRPNDINWNVNELVVKATPWGDLIVNGVDDPHLAQLHYSDKNMPTLVTIDMRYEPRYQHLEFYKNLFQKLSHV
jgi:hypothetical protein